MAVPASGTEQTGDASLTFPMDKKIDARPMRDLEIDALAALEASGPARSETMKQVGIVRNAADMRGLSFAQRGSTEDLTGYTSSTSVITDRFNSQTLTKMEVALERACRMLPVGGEEHPVKTPYCHENSRMRRERPPHS